MAPAIFFSLLFRIFLRIAFILSFTAPQRQESLIQVRYIFFLDQIRIIPLIIESIGYLEASNFQDSLKIFQELLRVV